MRLSALEGLREREREGDKLSYSITISGHKTVQSPEDGKAFEEKIAAKARDFVAGLEGVSYASIAGERIGSVNLMEGADANTES